MFPPQITTILLRVIDRLRLFLRTGLGNKYSHITAVDMLAALAESSARQYESCWKSFQLYLRQSGTESISESKFIAFLSHLFHVHKRSLDTVSTHSAALIDPLAYGCNIEIPKRARELIRKGFFRQRPTPRPTFPKWSLHRILFSLTEEFPVNLSPDQLLLKTCFLLALASGLRVSQLRALTVPWQGDLTQFYVYFNVLLLFLVGKAMAIKNKPGAKLTPLRKMFY